MVDRPWARKEDGWGIQFNWDTFLSSWASSWTYPELAKENMLSGYDVQLPDGKIPLYSSPGAAGRAEPPITAGKIAAYCPGTYIMENIFTYGR